MLTNEDRAGYGAAAVEVGTPDRNRTSGYEADQEDARIDGLDTIANVLHFLFQSCGEHSLDAREQFALSALDSASMHFGAELRGAL